MPIDAYEINPALRPTVLVHEVMKNVYIPSLRALPPNRSGATENTVARETPRAA